MATTTMALDRSPALKDPAICSIPSEHEMLVYETMADQAVSSKMYKGIGEKAGVMMIMLAARELGIPPMQALNGGINIIQGKVEISARMMSALIRKAGHYLIVKQSSDEACVLVGKRIDTGESQEACFSVAEAQKAGLIKLGGGWSKWPKDMCFARALSRLARQLFSDVIGIGYIEGELKHNEQPVAFPEDVPLAEYNVTESDQECTNRFLSMFPLDEAKIASRYLTDVEAHFEWTRKQTVTNLMEDPKRMLDKYLAWRAKNFAEPKPLGSQNAA